MRWNTAHGFAALVLMTTFTTGHAGHQQINSQINWQTHPPTKPQNTAPHAAQRTVLYQHDFRHGTYIIDRPGHYQLGEHITFNPNSKAVLNELCEQQNKLPGDIVCPVDAYQAGKPLSTQFATQPAHKFAPGGLFDRRYDPSAYGLGFFAAIVITAPDVTLDLNGFRLEQSEEHALLQRFFALVELANMPFIPGQGPAGFGPELQAAENVAITNGILGRSAHHGIHGNGNRKVRINNIDFEDFEVAALALNGVSDLRVAEVRASNRTDVPVLGTFSSAQFIKPYVEYLVANDSSVELNGQSAMAIRNALRIAINNVHYDLIEQRHLIGGRPQIDPHQHRDEFALFGNPTGFVDGNSYSFVINPLGVAVNGFPLHPHTPARDINFHNVHVDQQSGFVKEVIALQSDGRAVIDPVGAVFQTLNRSPAGDLITTTEQGGYVGNVVANAQALVAKAAWAGEFAASNLDISRNSITPEILEWVQSRASLPGDGPQRYLCNGDSMFHVNKGVIAFKMDGASNVRLRHTSALNLRNVGTAGSEVCGDYSTGKSHPGATLHGYGGARVRGYSFAGSRDIRMTSTRIEQLESAAGDAIALDVMTDTRDFFGAHIDITGLRAGLNGPVNYFLPNSAPRAVGVAINEQVKDVEIRHFCTDDLSSMRQPAHLLLAETMYPPPACSNWPD